MDCRSVYACVLIMFFLKQVDADFSLRFIAVVVLLKHEQYRIVVKVAGRSL